MHLAENAAVHVPPIWQLRIGDHRVFYDVDETDRVVFVLAVLVPARRQERISDEEAVARFRSWRRRRRRIEMSTEEILAARHEGHRW